MTGSDSSISRITTTTGYAATFGFLAALFQSAWKPVNNMHTLRNLGRGSIFCGCMGMAFASVATTFESILGKRNYATSAAGGAAAGLILGLRTHHVPSVVGAVCGLATLGAIYEWNGRSLKGPIAMYSKEEKESFDKAFFKQ